MRAIPAIFLTLCTSAVVGCPGTLDDSEFNAYGGNVAPVQLNQDGGGATRDAAMAWDSGTKWASNDAASSAPSWNDASARPSLGDAAAVPPSEPADAGGTGSAVAPSCDFRALMQARCGNASCHGGPDNSTGLDLTSPGLAERVKDAQGSGACGQYLMIDTQTPDQSALYLKVTESACGVRMPIGASLNNAEQACILQWIENL